MAVIKDIIVKDVRFPTSLEAHGSDAMHKDPDYSAAYVIIKTDRDDDLTGHGIAFTLGRGTEIIVMAVKVLAPLVVGMKTDEIFKDFGSFYRLITSESQLRWIGPEKGVVHLATAGVLNALWDLWAKMEGKPLWKLLVDMPPEQLVSAIDFRYITDAITREEALEILQRNSSTKKQREDELKESGYPAYTTSVGWLGYSDEKIRNLCREALHQGWTRFKVKVGADIEDDVRRCQDIRNEIGWERILMMDANQRWDVNESITNMRVLAQFKPLWIEEPTSPDDVIGHAKIAKELRQYDIGVATGEMCQNRVMFKQFLQAEGLSFCQIDSCRLGGVNEILAVLFMSAKFGVPVCPHAGGVGLCEMVQHLSIYDYICVSASLQNRVVEFVDHLHQHFKDPVKIKNGSYIIPVIPGYSTEMTDYEDYEFPCGNVWKQLITEGKLKI